MAEEDLEALTRARLRALRLGRGWSLDDLAARAGLSASTISRIETGRRTIGLDVLVALARSLGVTVDELVTSDQDADVVIRPQAAAWDGATVWALSRTDAPRIAVKMRLEPTGRAPDPQVHPGYDWMFVLTGTVLLTLGSRTVLVRAGEAADFSTMTPHSVGAYRRPAELLMVVDREGERSHRSRPPAAGAEQARRRTGGGPGGASDRRAGTAARPE